MKPSSQEKKKFVEERARQILFYQFPKLYQNSYLSESPDIQTADETVCVEVTNALTREFQASMSRIGNITEKEESPLAGMNQADRESNRVAAQLTSNGDYFASFGVWGDIHDIEHAYENKLKKLNSAHFQKCRTNNLFIYAWFIDDEDLFASIKTIQQLYREESAYSVHFHTVYLFTGSLLIEINLGSSQVLHHAISEEILNEISHRSFELIMGMSRDEYRRRNP